MLPREPTRHTVSPYTVDTDDYKHDLVTGLTETWRLAEANIEGAQRIQKSQKCQTNFVFFCSLCLPLPFIL